MEPLATSINDAAKALGIGRTSIYELIRAERLDVFKLGRRTLVKVESVRRLLECDTPLSDTDDRSSK